MMRRRRRRRNIGDKQIDEIIELVTKAMNKELEPWISYSAFTIAKLAGVPVSHAMAARWVLTWKSVDDDPDHPTGRKAKARLVVN